MLFLEWLCDKKKRIKRWQDNIDIFRPVTRKGRFIEPQSNAQTEWLCAALALFQQFLVFASERNDWLTQEEAREILFRYWQLVLPESAPQKDSCQADTVEMSYQNPEVFYRFLSEHFIPTYRSQILQASTGTSETMGLIRTLDNEGYLIMPRRRFFEFYAQWLSTHHASSFDLSKPINEAAVQRQLSEAGIPLRHETNNPATWRFTFYGKTSGKVNCLALPLEQLPEQIKIMFGNLFGSSSAATSDTNQSETAPDSSKEVKPL